MNAQQLRNSILQEAIEGRLVPQDPNDEPASILLERIHKEKERLVKEGKLKKKDLEVKPISEDEIPFDIPESWEWVRISDVVNVLMGQSPDGNDVFEAKEGDKAYEFHQGKICFTEKYITPSGKWCKIPSRIANKDSLLICVRAPIGDVNITQRSIGIGRGLAAMEGMGNISNIFLFYWMLAHKRCLEDQGTGSTFKAITVEVLKNQKIPLPPLAEQKRIVAKIEELLPKVEAYGKAQESLDKLNEELPERLKKSILQEAIEGRLVPQDPNDEPASVLLDKIRKEKEQLVKEGKLKKKDLIETPITEEEIPFEIPESWEWVRLGDVSEIARGGSPRPIKEYLTDAPNGLNWIKIGDTDKGGKYINSCKEKIKPEGLKKTRMVHPGDFLLTNSMSFGRPYITNIEGCIHDGWLMISPYAGIFDQSLLFYVLSSAFAHKQFSDKVAGAVVQNLNSDKVADSFVPLPPLAEQHRIVEKLEQLLGEIDKLKV